MSQPKTLYWCQFPRNEKSIPRDETWKLPLRFWRVFFIFGL